MGFHVFAVANQPGVYDVIFVTPFPPGTRPSASVTQVQDASNNNPGSADITDPTATGGDPKDNAVIIFLGANKMRVLTGNKDGNGEGRNFSFIVMGPRHK
jgi:hypothetical protein